MRQGSGAVIRGKENCGMLSLTGKDNIKIDLNPYPANVENMVSS